MRNVILIAVVMGTAACGSSSSKPKAPPTAKPISPAPTAAATPAPPDKTGPDPHELFQAAAASGDVAVMTRVNIEIGVADKDGVPNDAMEAFMNAHIDWAMKNAQWIMDNATDPALAVEWLRKNYDASLAPPPPAPARPAPVSASPRPAVKVSAKTAAKAAATAKQMPHELFQAAAAAGEVDLMTRVNIAVGITDDNGVPNDTMETFMNDHIDWAMKNAQWIMDNTAEPAKAAAWLRANFDPDFQLP